MSPPKEIELKIETIGHQGDGICRGPRGPVFAAKTAPGDQILASLQRQDDGSWRAESYSLIRPSALRQNPPCQHFDHCDNCQLQQLQNKVYRQWKIDLVKNELRKCRVAVKNWLEPVFLGEHQRRRATFSAQKRQGKIAFGYYRRRSQNISHIEDCLVVSSDLLGTKRLFEPFLNDWLMENRPLDFFIQQIQGKTELVITGLIGNKKTLPPTFLSTLPIIAEGGGFASIGWRAREEDPVKNLWGQGLSATFGKIRVNLPPDSFLQPTQAGEEALCKAVMAVLPENGKFADLFSGCGTFAGRMLERGDVAAFELSAQAVSSLRDVKVAAGFKLSAYERNLFTRPLSADELKPYRAVVFDPPRAGAEKQAIQLGKSSVEVIIGISCNANTFARDARAITQGGFHLSSVQLIDQFLWSSHLELVGVFTKPNRA